MPRRPILPALLLAPLILVAEPLGVWAQESGPAPAAPEEPAGEPAPEAGSRPSGAPFMQPLGRLANILGSVHFLRTLCGDEDAELWRTKMNEIIDAQNPNEADRRILIAQFNGGYRAFEATYRQCTPAAEVATRRYLEEGAALSREISVRYGN